MISLITDEAPADLEEPKTPPAKKRPTTRSTSSKKHPGSEDSLAKSRPPRMKKPTRRGDEIYGNTMSPINENEEKDEEKAGKRAGGKGRKGAKKRRA